ncbi:MAG TPA: hypothetical protein VEU52_04755 [Candidatus Limnocylindrales bacterium]|nr:hypothetical protein [Candidatus Limnocylindrales bacterium]
MPPALIFLKRVLVAVAPVIVVSYGCDNLWIHWRMRGADTSRAMDRVTFYYSTTLKNGKSEIFFDQPQKEICSRSLYPQLGHRPCWYARRNNIVSIGSLAPRIVPPKIHFTSASKTPVSTLPARLT